MIKTLHALFSVPIPYDQHSNVSRRSKCFGVTDDLEFAQEWVQDADLYEDRYYQTIDQRFE